VFSRRSFFLLRFSGKNAILAPHKVMPLKPIFRNLRVALLLLMLAAVIPAFALVIAMGQRQHQREVTEATEDVRRLSVLSASQQERQIHEAFVFLNSLVKVTPHEKLPASLPSLSQQNRFFNYIGIVDTNGAALATGKAPEQDFTTVAGQAWFQETLQSQKPTIGAYQLDPATGTKSLILSCPIPDKHGSVHSVLFGALDLEWLRQTLPIATLPAGRLLIVTDRAGQLLYAFPQDIVSETNQPSLTALFTKLHKAPISVSSDLHKTPRIYSATPIGITPGKMDLLVITGTPQTPILSSANKIFRNYLLMLLGFATVTFLSFWLLSNWIILDRVRRLVVTARNIGAGNLKARTGMGHDAGELGELARAFDAMADSLQRKETEYEQAVIAERQIESELRESEDMFRSLSASSPLGIFMVDTEGRCTYANPRYRSIAQLSISELSGSSWLQIIHPYDRHQIQEDWDAFVRGGENFIAKARLAPHGNNEQWILARAARMLTKSNHLTGYVGTIEDITERELTEQEIANWKRRYELIASASSQVVYDYDITADRVAWSGSIELVLGYQLPEMNGGLIQWVDLIHPDERDSIHRQLQAAREHATPFDVEYRFRHRLGHYVQIHDRGFFIPDASGKSIHMIGMMEDITERKRAEAAVRESERRFRDLFENSPDAVFVEDQNGVVVDVNPAGCRLHQLSREQLIGRNVLDLVPPQERDQIAADFSKWFTGEQNYYDGFTYTSTGHCLPVEIRGTLIQYQGHPAVLLHVRDITERKLAEQALRDSNRRLQEALAQLKHTQQQMLQQEHLRALGQMASGIAHDFNNALASILGFSELLLKHPEKISNTEKTTRYLHLIHTAAHDAASVVNRLREFYRSRDENEVFTSVDINQIVQQAVSLTKPRWKTQAEATGINIKVVSDLSDIPSVNGDAAALREALTNLILNSVDAMPVGGTITIHTRVTEKHAVIDLTDTGIGMSEEVLQRCLDPFFSTKGASGTGLGLSMVYGILQRHGGNISITSELGRGTTCTLSLPIPTTAPSPPPDFTPPAGTADALPPQHILVVDDEPQVRDVVCAFLTNDGHTVSAFADGQEALDQSRVETFDAAVIDRAMPGMSGDQLAIALKSRAPQLPVIMLTGFGNLMNEVGERPTGVDLVLAKPLTIQALQDALRKLLQHRHQA
jgi:PAS domain S-box-containing protein